MNAREVLSTAASRIAQVVKARVAAASLLSDRKTSLDKLELGSPGLVDAQATLDAEEVALQSVERQLILAGDDDGLAQREALLSEIAANRTRLVVLLDEFEARKAKVESDADFVRLRKVAQAQKTELEQISRRLTELPQVLENLESLLKASDRAVLIYANLSTIAESHPEIPELAVSAPPASAAARATINRLYFTHAGRHE